MLNTFINAIRSKKIVRVTFYSKKEGSIVTRSCIPFDFAPGSREKVKIDKYQLMDLDSPSGPHNLAVKPEDMKNIEITNKCFNPGDYIKWETNWKVERDWDQFS